MSGDRVGAGRRSPGDPGRPPLAPIVIGVVSVLCSLASGQGWSFADGEAPRLFEPGFLAEADYGKVFIGETYWFDIEKCTPSGGVGCVDGDGHSIPQFAKGYLEVGKAGQWWGSPPGGSWDSHGSCGHCWTMISGWDYTTGDPALTIPLGWKPGVRQLRARIGSAGVLEDDSEVRLINLVLPDVVDVGVKKFDVLDEQSLCLGALVTLRYWLFNWGELDAENALVQFWVADDKQMTTNAQLLAEIPSPQVIVGGDTNGQAFEHTMVLPGFAKGLRYFQARTVWDPSDLEPPPFGTTAPKVSAPDKVSVLADFDFVGNGLVWETPAGGPAKVFPGQECTFSFEYRNIGRVPTEPFSRIRVEMKKGHQPWESIGSLPFVPAIECHSGTEQSATVHFTMPSDDPDEAGYHPYVEIGKLRSFRLVFENGGPPAVAGEPSAVAETKYKNNRSKVKLVRFVEPPVVDLQLVRGEFVPRGRDWLDPVGAPGNRVQVTASLATAGPERRLRFELDDVSREPGICINFGSPTEPDYDGLDLQFLLEGDGNTASDFLLPEASGDYGMVMETADPVLEMSAFVSSFDYAARGRVRAVALDELGQPIGAPSEWLSLPDDDNGNKIWDGWLWESWVAGGEWDDFDLEDPDWGAPGDGLTRFEEYRGVMVSGGQHLRLSPALRDLFVHREDPGVPLALATSMPYFLLHEVDSSQMNGHEESDPDESGSEYPWGTVNPSVAARVVNFNWGATSPHYVEQHGIVLGIVPPANVADPSLMGSSLPGWNDQYVQVEPTLSSMSHQVTPEGTPGWTRHVDLYPSNMVFFKNPPESGGVPWDWTYDATAAHFQDYFEATVLHELGHCLSVHHHNWDTDVSGVVPENCSILFATDYPMGVTWPMKQAGLKYVSLFGETGDGHCVMRYNWHDVLAAICGDADKDGLPGEVGETPVADWGSSFWRLYRFCDDDAANDYCSPEWDPDCSGAFAAEQHLEGSGPQECVSQLVVNDFWTPDLFCGKDDDPHCP